MDGRTEGEPRAGGQGEGVRYGRGARRERFARVPPAYAVRAEWSIDVSVKARFWFADGETEC